MNSKALAAHILNQDGQMQLATARYLEAVSGVRLYTQADIGIQLPHQTLGMMAGSDEFTFLTCQRAVVYHETMEMVGSEIF